MAFTATYLGSNGWIIEFSKCKIVIDPWLRGDLVFPPGEWLFKGSLEKDIPTPKDIDLILITQGLPDHCHIPSLKLFSKDTEIICPKSALKILEELNFTSIKVIEPSEELLFRDIQIEATSGAPVPQIENGYIIENSEGGFYIEPHGYFDKNIKSRKLDAVITPTKNLGLPIVGSFVRGAQVLPDLIDKFNPKFILSSTIGGDVKFTGFLNNFISIEEYKNEINCEIIDLKTMQSINI